MGLRDKLTELRDQAQATVAEHKDQIQGAVETAGAAVDRKTHGKYTDKIVKYGQKANDAVENLGGQATGEKNAGAPPNAAAAGAPSGPTPDGGTTDA
jgi:MT0933-like antitoxin protein